MALHSRSAILLAVVTAMFAAVLTSHLVTPASAIAQPQSQTNQVTSPTRADIEAQDRLIAAQEALLNVYRCMFWVDIRVVTGGCDSAQPNQPATQPSLFAGIPTQQEAITRQQLINAQEILLNTMRCRFGIDTQIVPKGCSNSAQTQVGLTTIGLPATAPNGRCANLLADGVYGWERCAWRGCEFNEACNPQISEKTAQHLINLIWNEVATQGKPKQPPTNQLDPTDTFCTLDDEPVSCYVPSKHHIRRIEGDLQTVLHETAHALVTKSKLSRSCITTDNETEDTICGHHDLFRCVADHLYQRYAGLAPAEVCGTTLQSQQPNTIKKQGWRVWREAASGRVLTSLTADFHTRPAPYKNSEAWLTVQCADGDVDIYLGIDEGALIGQPNLQGRVRVAHAFLPPADFIANDWLANFSERATFYNWKLSTDRTGAFIPDGHEEDFINTLVRSEFARVAVVVWNSKDETFGAFHFSSSDAQRQIRPVTEQCGWTWQQARATSNDTTWTTNHGNYGTYTSTRVDHQYRPEPYQSAQAWLNVQCNEGNLNVYLLLEHDVGGHLSGQAQHSGRIPVSHVVLTKAEHHDTQRRQAAIDAKSVYNFWGESNENRGAFMPAELHEDFINALVAPEARYAYLWVTNADGNQFGTFVFRSVNARPHVVPVTEQCGWTWS